METRYIDFAVEGQHIKTGDVSPIPVGDTQLYLAARFAVDESWNGLEKLAVFSSNSLAAITVPLNDDGTCFFPSEVLVKPIRAVGVGLIGFGDGAERLTTNRALVEIENSCYVEGKTPQPPAPDVYAELARRKLDCNQGAENAGKVLVIGDDGMVVPGDASSGGVGGRDGGYYVPTVSQPGAGMMRVSYAASAEGMPAVEPVDVPLPQGEPGNDYVPTDADKAEIAEAAAKLVEIPDTYTRKEIDAIMGAYVNDIDALIGGES